MTRLTALELIANYPDNILVEIPLMNSGKYALFVYLKRDGLVHKLMFNSEPEWDTKEQVIDYMNLLVKSCEEAL